MIRTMPVPITLSDGSTWERPVGPSGVALLLMNLFNHDFRTNEKRIFPGLGIDMAARRGAGTVPNVESRRTHEYRIINKALAMELLTGLMLTHLNSATQVRSWCQTRNGVPLSFAPAGHADLDAAYGEPSNGETFRVIAEVSAKRHVSPEFFGKQLEQTWRHANELNEGQSGGRVYALVVNGGSVIQDLSHAGVFHKFVKEKSITRRGMILVIPVYAPDLAVAVRRIEEELPTGAIRFGASIMESIPKELFNSLFLSREELLENPDKHCDILVDHAMENVRNSVQS